MKKIIIYMSRLKYGGMELSLVDFLNMSNITKNNDVYLYLGYCLNNEILNNIPSNIHVIVLAKKWNLLGKINVFFKLVFLLIKNFLFKYKYNISICYSNHQSVFSKLARLSGKKTILFVHSDLSRYDNITANKMKNKIRYNKFDIIICNSQKSKKSLEKLYSCNLNIKVIPNYINGENIIKKSKEKINLDLYKDSKVFINIANHVEEFKNLSLIIEVCNELKSEYKFKVLLIGSGKDTSYYQELIDKYDLNEFVYILGSKKNPYPYLKNSSGLIFSSLYEGYGIVLNEAKVLGTPIISSDCGASREIVEKNYGFIFNNKKELKEYIIKLLNNSFEVKEKFDYNKFNNDITSIYEKIFNNT